MSMNLEQARQNMVDNQVRTWDVLDARVLDTLSGVRREDYVPEAYRSMAFADLPLPLGHGQMMMKPVVEGRVLQALALDGSENVLEIGTGSGFLTACLARLSSHVTSVDMHADFIEGATARLAAAAIGNVDLAVAEAVHGYTPGRRFDAVVVTGAVYQVPDLFLTWLEPGGRLFVVRGESPAMQACLLHCEGEGRYREESLFETDIPYLTHAEPPRHFTL